MIEIFIDELQKLGDIQKMFEKLTAKGGDIAALGKKIKAARAARMRGL